MKLRPRKGGHGHVTSYDVTIGSADARKSGLVDEDGQPLEAEKIIDAVNRRIIIQLKQDEQEG